MHESEVRLARLRARMTEHELVAYIVPHNDEHQQSYLPPCAERLAWLSGFTGSAGNAVVTRDRAALFIDGRYTIQAPAQTGTTFWEHHNITETTPDRWLARNVQPGDRVGFDPRLLTPETLATLASSGAAMVPIEENLIDAEWHDRPAPPQAPVELYPEELAGESAGAKRARILEALAEARCDALVVTAPDSLAWLFNLRGGDVATTPLALGHAIVRAEGSRILMDPAKLGAAVRAGIDARFEPPEALADALDGLRGARVRVDQATCSAWIVERLTRAGATVDVGADPCALPKACKNPSELAGIRAAHERDGVALVRFMRWFAENTPGDLDEWVVARRVEAFRAEGEHFRGLSFNTISAFGANAALAHYSVARESAARLGNDAIFLVDSGVQYTDGTTDVTRTFVIGTPTAEMTRRYTQVLKGHIALATARFPEGTTGIQLDALARQFLWQDGVDYDHGTGHGVGCYLGVHEGPQGISKRPNKIGLRPGMVVSDEPGYYKAGAFGIRIENLVVVVALDPQPAGAERLTLGFDTLTLAPYERRLIDVPMLTTEERAWIDAYHARVRRVLEPRFDAEDRAFLTQATEPLPATLPPA